MTTKSKSKLKENNEPIESKTESKKAKPIVDFMPGFAKQEAEFEKALMYDFRAKKYTDR